MTRALTVIGVPCSAGAHHGGLERGPAALRAAGLLDRLRQAGCEVYDAGDLTPQVFTADAAHPRARNRDAVVQACRDVAAATGQAIAAGRIPVLVGGDCSITAGAVAGCLAQRPDTGLLYLDGDADLRTPQTTIASAEASTCARAAAAAPAGSAATCGPSAWLSGRPSRCRSRGSMSDSS